jgi:hypothetical protein
MKSAWGGRHSVRVLTAALVALAALLTSGLTPARADPNDDQFVYLLQKHGIQSSNGRSGLISLGLEICNNFQMGYSPQAEVDRAAQLAPTISAYQARYAIVASVVAYCPSDANLVPTGWP